MNLDAVELVCLFMAANSDGSISVRLSTSPKLLWSGGRNLIALGETLLFQDSFSFPVDRAEPLIAIDHCKQDLIEIRPDTRLLS